MKNIEIIPIARGKLERRKIDYSWVIETIHSPGQVVEGYGGRKVAQRKYKIDEKEYLLRVIYEEKGEEIIVLTGYLTSQISRYWEEMRDENRIRSNT